jgi:hypothetical protein
MPSSVVGCVIAHRFVHAVGEGDTREEEGAVSALAWVKPPKKRSHIR